MSSSPPDAHRPELLAPAGDSAALAAALQAGADAVYFGLAEGFNARARAGNFSLANLAATTARIHRAGARAYLALNTLVFESELAFVERLVRAAAASGVDALIVQDPAVALLARGLCPELEVHASTQMTISSPEAARFAESLGVTRAVVPRELSVDEIRAFRAGTRLELEVFVHGALCVAWSGQCLSSAVWSGRSANRGECAQSCRMPYDLLVDGERRELGDVKYLLSPKDLAGLPIVRDLAAIGVHGLKIEGRQKNAQYVLTATGAYRHWLDGLERDACDPERARADLLRASLSYTRGFSPGFLGGSDHQHLVDGRFPKHRGVLVGTVVRVGPGWVEVERADPAQRDPHVAPLALRAGLGVVFDAGDPEDKGEPGGPLFGVDESRGALRLRFGTPGPDLARVAPGQRVWVTGDPVLANEANDAVGALEPDGRNPLRLEVTGAVGAALVVRASGLRGVARHVRASASSALALQTASGRGLDDALLADKLAAFGGTPFALGELDRSGLAAGLHLPVSELKSMRRALVAELVPQLERGPLRSVRELPPRARVARGSPAAQPTPSAHPMLAAQSTLVAQPTLVALCRTDAQLEAAIEAGLGEVELDWMELVGLGRAVARAREAGLRAVLATLRVHKPGEENYEQRLAALAPAAILARHWAALEHFRAVRGVELHGDFSLNVSNSITADELFARGFATLTPAHDLDRERLLALLDASDPTRFTIVLQHRMPTFHTEHCVYAHLLSNGRDHRTCGRPCDSHALALRDVEGRALEVIVDAGCRNTVFDATVQSAAAAVPELLARGVRRFRVEFVRESRAQAAGALRAYGELLAGACTPEHALAAARAHGRVGVAEQMAVMR
ncbi:MAG: U32 family peptidase [Planctomycetota bacterium]|nr:MAG: U32 family peptidase [Planctomycetota bacterium]